MFSKSYKKDKEKQPLLSQEKDAESSFSIELQSMTTTASQANPDNNNNLSLEINIKTWTEIEKEFIAAIDKQDWHVVKTIIENEKLNAVNNKTISNLINLYKILKDRLDNVKNSKEMDFMFYGLIDQLFELNEEVFNLCDVEGNTILNHLIKEGDYETAEFVLEHITTINSKNTNGDTTLHIAVATNDPSIVKKVLEKSTPETLSNRNKNHQTPFQLITKNEEVCDDILKAFQQSFDKLSLRNQNEMSKLEENSGITPKKKQSALRKFSQFTKTIRSKNKNKKLMQSNAEPPKKEKKRPKVSLWDDSPSRRILKGKRNNKNNNNTVMQDSISQNPFIKK